MKYCLLIAIAFFLLGSQSFASEFGSECVCKKLSDDKKAIAAQIIKTQHPYDCCDKTIAECIDEQNPCRIAVRLRNMVCRMLSKGKSVKDIERALEKRAMSMTPSSEKIEVDLATAAFAGDKDAPVTLTLYTCVRCPYCAILIPSLYKEVMQGSLKGKVRLVMKLFPIKGHEGSTESGITAMVAYQQNMGFEFLLYAYEHFDDFETEKMPAWAKEVGIEAGIFDKSYKDAATRKALVDSKREGIKNKVKATPTLFINDRRYLAPMNIEMMLDVLEEEYERRTGKERQR